MPFKATRKTLAVSVTPDYSSGDIVGGLLDFSMRTPGGGGLLKRLTIKSKVAIANDSVVYLFDSEPDNGDTAVADNAAFSLAEEDKTKLIGRVAVATASFVNIGAVTEGDLYLFEVALDIPFKFEAENRTIYAAWVAGGSINVAAVDDIEMILGAELD